MYSHRKDADRITKNLAAWRVKKDFKNKKHKFFTEVARSAGDPEKLNEIILAERMMKEFENNDAPEEESENEEPAAKIHQYTVME